MEEINEKQPYYFSTNNIFYGRIKNNNAAVLLLKKQIQNYHLFTKTANFIKGKEISNTMGENFFDSELDNEIKITKISKKLIIRKTMKRQIFQLSNKFSIKTIKSTYLKLH